MIKDLHEFIIVDVKDLQNENMNELLIEISLSVKSTIDESIPQ